MKHLITLTILILLTSLNACQRPDYPHTLQQAESVMNARPDSALQLLQSMADSLAMLPEEAQMYYHLLTIQAKDKQYITHTSDSLINRIVSFYEDYDDKERLMLAYYYQGSVYRDMNDAPRALKAFQQTVDLNIPNQDLLAKTYNQMGKLFMYQGLHDEVIQVNRKAMEAYLSLGKRNKISYAQRDIARMYDMKETPDSALHYYKEACQTALADKDSAKFYGILSELGGYYYKIEVMDTAKQILLFTKNINFIRNKTHIYAMLGHIYKTENLLDSADYYYQKATETGNIHHTYNNFRHLFTLESQKGNHAKATEYIQRALTLKDSIDRMNKTEEIAKINALYNYQHFEAEYARLKLSQEVHKNWILVLSIIILLTISCLVCLNLNRQRKKERKLRMSEFVKSELYKEIWTASNEEDANTINSPEKWASIQESIDTIYPGFTDKVYHLSPSLTPTELRVCWLTKIGIPPAGIARVLNLSKQAISNARSKLAKKMQQQDGEPKSFDKLIEKL